jgi:DNA-binding transcriptional LysR family regulator
VALITSKLDLNLLPVIVALAEHRSVSAAARHLGMSQPAVSAALGRLRASLGDPLFVRTARGMEATPRALTVLAPARAALGIVDQEILPAQGFHPSTSDRKITLALSDIGEMVFLPKILARLQAEAPRMTVRSVTLPVSQLERGLELGEIDLAIGYFPDLKGNNFFQQRLFSHGFVCLLRHPQACGREHAPLHEPARHHQRVGPRRHRTAGGGRTVLVDGTHPHGQAALPGSKVRPQTALASPREQRRADQVG